MLDMEKERFHNKYPWAEKVDSAVLALPCTTDEKLFQRNKGVSTFVCMFGFVSSLVNTSRTHLTYATQFANVFVFLC